MTFLFVYLFIYFGFYVAFNTVQVISRWVVGRAEETSTYSSLGFCTVNCRPTASNYQLSHLRPCQEPNPGLRGGRLYCLTFYYVLTILISFLQHKIRRLKIQHIYQLNWVNQFELLGITFHVTQEKMFHINFDKRISEIERIISMYSKFILSLIGRVTVIKTLMLPKIVYILTVLPTPPSNIFYVIEKRLKDFLWKNGNVRICNKQLENEIGEGGLKLTNIMGF